MSELKTIGRVFLDCIRDFNNQGRAALAFDGESVVSDLLQDGLLERRQDGLWITAKGRKALGERVQ